MGATWFSGHTSPMGWHLTPDVLWGAFPSRDTSRFETFLIINSFWSGYCSAYGSTYSSTHPSGGDGSCGGWNVATGASEGYASVSCSSTRGGSDTRWCVAFTSWGRSSTTSNSRAHRCYGYGSCKGGGGATSGDGRRTVTRSCRCGAAAHPGRGGCTTSGSRTCRWSWASSSCSKSSFSCSGRTCGSSWWSGTSCNGRTRSSSRRRGKSCRSLGTARAGSGLRSKSRT